MKRLQIMIEEELDARLDRLAAEEGTSKAALIRRFVAERLAPPSPIQDDPLWEMVGTDDYEPADVDSVVYE
jgi:hypothetical protein